jgi:Zn ribbon nucleic-acid-binding protein
VLNEQPITAYWDENNYSETRNCINCNYAYECATVWQNIHPNVTYEISTKDKTYCLKYLTPA